ncbi:hypothetical protein [Limosilactobacillus caccae]|jgi:hypothetical protein|nr:hypothetical protein [Limosilactobacillus caccae]
MALINFLTAWTTTTVILTLSVMFGASFIISFIFWLTHHQNLRKG